MATKEYHSKHQANKLTLVFSTDGGVVLVNEDPNSMSPPGGLLAVYHKTVLHQQ
jgi:hypothetical protein